MEHKYCIVYCAALPKCWGNVDVASLFLNGPRAGGRDGLLLYLMDSTEQLETDKIVKRKFSKARMVVLSCSCSPLHPLFELTERI